MKNDSEEHVIDWLHTNRTAKSTGFIRRRTCVGVAVLLAGAQLAIADPLNNWTERPSGVGTDLHGIAYGNGRYVCVGQAGVILVSSNGHSWQAAASGTAKDLFGVAFAGGRYVTVGAAGLILKSTNLTEWVAQPSPTTNQLNAVARCADWFVATGLEGTLLTSPDGSAWVKRDTGTSQALFGCAFGNDLFLAVGQRQSDPRTVLVSSNGVDWAERSGTNASAGSYDVVFGSGRFAVAGPRGLVYCSTDGIQWTSHQAVTGISYLFGLTFAHNAFVAVGGPFGGGSQTIVTSPDGMNWQTRFPSITSSLVLRAVTYGNGSFIAVGEKGLIVQSGPVFSLQVARTPANTLQLVLDGEAGRAYRIQSCSDLYNPNWTDVLAVTNTTETQSYLDGLTNNAPTRFYRGVTP